MKKKTKNLRTNNGSAEVFDQRPVTEKDIKGWCKNVKGKNKNGVIVTIPNFCCGQIVSLDGVAITTNRIGGTLEVQVCTDNISRQYKIVSGNKFSRSDIALEKVN